MIMLSFENENELKFLDIPAEVRKTAVNIWKLVEERFIIFSPASNTMIFEAGPGNMRIRVLANEKNFKIVGAVFPGKGNSDLLEIRQFSDKEFPNTVEGMKEAISIARKAILNDIQKIFSEQKDKDEE